VEIRRLAYGWRNIPITLKSPQRRSAEAKENGRRNALTFAPRIEYQSTLWAFNLIPGHSVDFRRRDQMATSWTGGVEGSQNLLEINLSARPVRPVKLDFYDHPFTCPLCKEQIVYTSMHTVIVSSRRKC